jgi:cytochrome c peroxidase
MWGRDFLKLFTRKKGEKNMGKKIAVLIGVLFLVSIIGITASALTPNEELGRSIFFDQDLSFNGNQSCAVCHAPESGWTGPDSNINAHGAVYEGSIAGRFGNRKPPSSAYATQSPIFHFVINKKEALFIGGNFWDGRATGEMLGSPAAEQALGPFLNPLEQALPDAATVVQKVCESSYASLFTQVCGAGACNPINVSAAYDCIGLSIAAYEASSEVNAFTSKYDYYLSGSVDLSKEEKKGLNLFKSKGKCSKCHVLELGPNGESPLFTDFTYDNLGLPKNPENPFYEQAAFNPSGYRWIDLGLGGFLNTRPDYQGFAAENYGKHKVPTLRNVDKWDTSLGTKVKAFGHNGYFKSLKGIVHFYNTRDVKTVCLESFTSEADALAAGCWPLPEIPVNVNTSELGNLNLSGAEEDAVVSFLKTLSDGYMP